MKNMLLRLVPPPGWRIPALLSGALLAGLLLHILIISRAPSYLSDDPATCMNCHIMAPQYATWMHSSHREQASCNDCHVPHNNVINKYYFKAKDGLRHAAMFTLRREPQVITIREEGRHVVQDNCIRCHGNLLSDEKVNNYSLAHHRGRTDRPCWDCHRETPHGRVNSLSSVPYARVPVQGSPVPDWLKKILKENP